MFSGVKATTGDGNYYISPVNAEINNAVTANIGKEIFPSKTNFPDIIGRSVSLRKLLQSIETVAPTDASVLIIGETGTGKELVARAIHRLSRRVNRPFVSMNSAALPAALLETELFGHERGAFTGATAQRTGRFELAHQGTLFLDEIGDMPVELQPKLLRVLQEREFERLGSSHTRKVDVRVVAATNQDLLERVETGEFRRDLYYRLNVFPIYLPPLRERREDISLLANHFVRKFAFKMGKAVLTIPAETLRTLQAHDYPGNVRELENVIERAVILSTDGVLRIDFLHPSAAAGAFADGKAQTLESFERRFILLTLEATAWRVGGSNGAAARLGLNRSTLISKMRKLGISRREQPKAIA